jgi:hypothetical protein
MQDPIDAAIADIQSQETVVEPRTEAQLSLSSGRVVVVNVPTDISDTEWLDLVGSIAFQLRANVAAQRNNRPRLAIARNLPVARG